MHIIFARLVSSTNYLPLQMSLFFLSRVSHKNEQQCYNAVTPACDKAFYHTFVFRPVTLFIVLSFGLLGPTYHDIV